MANNLDELRDGTLEEGRDVNVIAKRLTVEKDLATTAVIWILYLVGFGMIGFGFISKMYYIIAVGVIVIGYVFSTVKKDESYLLQLEQRVQQSASQIDNYLEQRVMVLENLAKLVNKAIDLDKTVFTEVTKLRSHTPEKEVDRNEFQAEIDAAYRGINIAVENYPDIKAHREIADAIQQNLYLQREITAAREVYNDSVGVWNREIYAWPFKKYVAAKEKYTTRLPFIATKEVKERAREVFF